MALTPGKAKKMLDDGTVHGRGLTDKQKRYFGAIAGGATPMKKINGGWLDKYQYGGKLNQKYIDSTFNANMDKRWVQRLYEKNPEFYLEGQTKPSTHYMESGDDYVYPRVMEGVDGELKEVSREEGRSQGIKFPNDEIAQWFAKNYKKGTNVLKEYQMGGSLPGASGMMYGRSNTPPPLYTQSEMKAQDGREIAIDNTAVRSIRIPIIDKIPKKKYPNEVSVVQKTQPMFSQDNRSADQRKRDKAYTEEMNSNILPTGAMPLTYISNPFRLIGDLYNSIIQPAATSIFSTSTLQPATGDFWTSDEMATQLNSRRVQRERGQISLGDQLYGNLMQGLPETGWAAANFFGGPLLKSGYKYGKQFLKGLPDAALSLLPNNVRNITKYYTNSLGDAFKIGNTNPNIPTFLTRGQTPPNPLRGNPRPDANNFMQSWTNPNNASFVSRFDDQIMKPFPGGAMNENYLRVQTRELNVLQQQLDDFVETTGSNVLPKAKALQKSITQLENNINGFWKTQYPQLARNNMKAIQAGEFPTTYSTTGMLPGSGGTYYVPHSSQPMNNWKYMYPNQPNKMGIGNNSVVKLREVPVGATEAVKTKARTNEMLTGIHETLGHASNAGGAALTKQTNELIKGALKPNPKIKDGTSDYVKKFLGPKATFKDWTKYLQDETEMVARVMELRRQYIPKEFWGTSKQYQVDNKLIDQIFRDGLSGKSKIHADFFRVIDKKGLQKLMKGLYATIPMAIGADGLLEYKHGGNVPKAQMKNGGWLDNYEVIEDDMGQLTNPGKITKINSNNITMKGVNYPVLGVSDTGDTKMMQPGVENYTYDGSSVTEYPMAQDGLKLKTATPSFPYINRVPDPSPQVDFLKDWTNSTRGQELLSNSFDGDEKDIERLTYKRINNLDNVDFSIDDHASDFLGRYNRNRHDIKLNSSLLDTSEPKLIGNQDKDVVLHELSHAQDFSPDAEFNRVTIPFSDQKLINKYRKRTIKDTKKLDAPRKVRKDIKDRVNYIGDPTETRARLNSIRYFYETSPIGKEEGMPSIFDSEVTSDMMEVMKDNQQFRELQEVYNDEEILELLNTVSDNSKSSGPSNMAYAQEGAGVNKEGVKQYKWFKNYLQSPKYVERLKKEFPDYTDKQIGQEVKSRLENVMQTRVGFLPRSSDISTGVGGVQGVYDADEYPGSIMLRPEYSASTSDVLFESGNYLSGYNTIPLHEWSHAADDGGNRMPQSTTDLMLSKMKENSLDIPKDKYYYTRPTEYLGRMQPLRYLMEQEGLYDAGTQDFTKEDLEKAKQNKTIKNNVHFQDLMKNVNSDEDFIELMNTVASVNQKDNSRTMMAKQGRSLVTLDQLTNFTNYNTPQPGGWLDKY